MLGTGREGMTVERERWLIDRVNNCALEASDNERFVSVRFQPLKHSVPFRCREAVNREEHEKGNGEFCIGGGTLYMYSQHTGWLGLSM